MIKQYKIKKRYGLKGLPDKWFIYSRHILGRYIGVTKLGGRNLRRYRVSKGYATRKSAVRAAKKLQRKSNAIIRGMRKP